MNDKKTNVNNQETQKSNSRFVSKRSSEGEPILHSYIRKSRRQPELPEGTKVTAGQVVAIRRRELCWSQEHLSEKTELSRTQIGRIERDESIPSMESIERLEEALGIKLYDLFLEQKREQTRIRGDVVATCGSRNAIGAFEKELSEKGIVGKDLEKVLADALKSAESLLRKNKTDGMP